jgi:ankyrin repeat protein
VMLAADNGVSCLWISAQSGHLEVVNALLEAGGRELLMLTADGGFSCLYISAENGHLEVVNALLEVGARAADADRGRWMQLPPHQCAGGASGGGERAAGGRGARAGDDD